MDLNGKVCLITGASSGIGAALAERLVEAGARVVLFARRAELVEALAAQLGYAALAVPGDVTNRVDLDAAVAAAVDRFGGLDVLVNNAGVSIMGKLTTIPADLAEHGWRVNVMGPILAVQAANPALRPGGLIVNISSAMSLRPNAALAVYSASKAALNVLSASLRIELKDSGVRVLTVHPGFIANEFTQHTLAAGDMAADLARLQSMPSKRTSDDAARDIVAAIRDDADTFLSLDMPLTMPL